VAENAPSAIREEFLGRWQIRTAAAVQKRDTANPKAPIINGKPKVAERPVSSEPVSEGADFPGNSEYQGVRFFLSLLRTSSHAKSGLSQALAAEFPKLDGGMHAQEALCRGR